jgi:histidine ammonia-lyase
MVAGSARVDSSAAARERTRIVGDRAFCVADVLAVARGAQRVELDPDPAYRARLARGRATVERAQADGAEIYGVTTGVGASSDVSIPLELREDLAANLMRFHGCGTGRRLDALESAAVLTLRLVSLARGYSGVRESLLERLCDLLNARVFPVIPEEGSVGASGDLTPLSYLAALVSGEREALVRGRVVPASEALAELGLAAHALAPKESLAIMNGTAVMTAIACVNWERAARLARLAACITAMNVAVTHGNRDHFDARIFALKPHPGQVRCAAWIRADLELEPGCETRAAARLQDRYSLRCAPHVIGVLVDALEEARRILDIEINSVNDNPLVDPDREEVLHGGNFYGGHVCHAMDAVKIAVASVADLLDRQLALLCVPETSDGLPANLVAAEHPSHHGFKAMQISASALTAEALKLTLPAAAFSRSTESHNQDKVSMGTIAARDCRRILELAETVAAIVLLASCQALDLRDGESVSRRSAALHRALRKSVPSVVEDRRLDGDIARVLEMLRGDALPLGSSSYA